MDSTLDPGDFTFAGIEQALTNGLTTLVSVATVVGLIPFDYSHDRPGLELFQTATGDR